MSTDPVESFLNNRIIASADLDRALTRLHAGELVAFPTETVYGLGADACNESAVKKIFAAKGRPADHPVIVHIHEIAQLGQWAQQIPIQAYQLAEQFWPGPLTLVLQRAPGVSDSLTGGQSTIGLRCPAHPAARQLLQSFNGALAAPSANLFGRISPTCAAHVRAEFGPDLFVLDGGDCAVGIESTIVDLSRGVAQLLRPGHITPEQISRVIAEPLQTADKQAPRVAGSLAAHYAPRTPMQLFSADDLEPLSQALAQGPQTGGLAVWISSTSLNRLQNHQGLLGVEQLASLRLQNRLFIQPDQAELFAHELYAMLRTLDQSAAIRLWIELPPAQPQWAAVRDRLLRAAAGAAA